MDITQITEIIEHFSQNVDLFNYKFSIYQSSLDSLYKFTEDNITSVEITHNITTDNFRIVKVNPSSPLEDPNFMKRFYRHEFENLYDARIDIYDNIIEELHTDQKAIADNSDNPQIVIDTKAKLDDCCIRFDNSGKYHNKVLFNKHIKTDVTE